MNSKNELYDFSLKTLENVIDTLEICNSNMDDILKDRNVEIINKIKSDIFELRNNLLLFESGKLEVEKQTKVNSCNIVKNQCAIEEATRKLRDVINDQCNKIIGLKVNKQNEKNDSVINEKDINDICNFILNILIGMINSVKSINISENKETFSLNIKLLEIKDRISKNERFYNKRKKI